MYECVDEQTYAATAARKRKEARDFIDADIDPDLNDVDRAAYGMEHEFELEDELSVVKAPARGPEEEEKSAQPSPPPLRHEVSQHEVSQFVRGLLLNQILKLVADYKINWFSASPFSFCFCVRRCLP